MSGSLVADPPARGSTGTDEPRRAAPAVRRDRKRPIVVDVLAGLAGLGLGITLAIGISAESSGSLAAPGGIATAAGRLTGLAAAYGMAIVVLLVARIAPLERAVGQDRLVSWHRRLGPWPLVLLVGHGVFITLGYAQEAKTGVLHEFWQLLMTYPGVLAATAGFLLLIAAGVTSYRKARRRMAYETWWTVHLYTYLALFLSMSHQIDTGASFVGHPIATAFWWAIWVGTLVTVVGFRVALPAWRSARHQLRVERVDVESDKVVSITMRGRGLGRLRIAGGQFLQWRFLTKGMWWQAHPYSLSANPAGDRLRITVKDLGDHSQALARLQPGTRVAFEGPYGTFTTESRLGDRVLLVGAGVGSAPILALLQDLPPTAHPIVVLRGSRPSDLVLREEIAEETHRRDGRLLELAGPRSSHPLNPETLRMIAPDLTRRDVFVCGPDGFTSGLASALRDAGLPAERLHYESFTF